VVPIPAGRVLGKPGTAPPDPLEAAAAG
jgi:hypothetical protein